MLEDKNEKKAAAKIHCKHSFISKTLKKQTQINKNKKKIKKILNEIVLEVVPDRGQTNLY